MKCFHPLLIKDPCIQGQRREDSDCPRVYVPCGKCVACLSNRRRIWANRLAVERKYSSSALFVTLTYDEINEPRLPTGESTLSKRDIQTFMKRLRRNVGKFCDNKLRYFVSGEYGPTTLRPHYHMLLFNFPTDLVDFRQFILTTWKHGFITADYLLDGGSNYAAKYIMQELEYDIGNRQMPFSLMSRRPGIGMQILTPNLISYLQNAKKYFFPISKDSSFLLPQSMRNKVFDEETREAIYQQFLCESWEIFLDCGKKFNSDSNRTREADYRRDLQERERLEKSMIKALTKKHPYLQL